MQNQKPISRLTTAGQLRQFLADSIIAVKNKQMDAEVARNVVKLAGQLNESFYAEIKAKQVLTALGEATSTFGAQVIGPQDDEV
jgi:hypothetical protein